MQGIRMPCSTRLQSAVEFLTTYSWALIIIIGAIALIYLFLTTILTAVPSQCTLGTTTMVCEDIVVSSNALGSYAEILVVNDQAYSITNSILVLSAAGYGSLGSISCYPANVVLPGGIIVCTSSSSVTGPPVALNSQITGNVSFSDNVCPTIGLFACASPLPQETFNGIFTTHVLPLVTPVTCSIALTAVNTAPVHGSTPDVLNANVLLNGIPIQGATVSMNSIYAGLAAVPWSGLTNVNGTFTSSVTYPMAGTVTITAAFPFVSAACSNTLSLTFS